MVLFDRASHSVIIIVGSSTPPITMLRMSESLTTNLAECELFGRITIITIDLSHSVGDIINIHKSNDTCDTVKQLFVRAVQS